MTPQRAALATRPALTAHIGVTAGMRRFLISLTVPVALALNNAQAQAPPTRVEKARADDPQTGDLPPTASWRGTDIENRPYAETPTIEDVQEAPSPPAGTYGPEAPPAAFRTDGDNFPDLEEQPVDRYTYSADGTVARVDRYRRGEVEPFRSFDYEYTTTGTVIEREVMPDGARRFVREVGLDAFQAAQGPGNQPYRDNRDDSQAYPVENAARPTPAYPQLGTETDVSPE